MNLPEPKEIQILAIAVHPDDAELGCGGTLLTHKKMGYTTGILDLTQGELGTRGTITTRQKEAQTAAEILQLDWRGNIGLRDGFFRNDEASQIAIIEIIRRFRPQIVLTNAPRDRHPDHGRAHTLVHDACFLAGLSKIETKYQGVLQTPHRPRGVYSFIQALFIRPDITVDITEVFEVKMEAVKAYQSQFYNPLSDEPATFISDVAFLDFVKARAIEFGKISGFEYGEGFLLNRWPGVKDLMQVW